MQCPIGRLQTAQGNPVHRVQPVKIVHGGGGDEIDVRKRLAQDGDARWDIFRDGSVFCDEQKFLIAADGKKCVAAFCVADRKLRGVGQRKGRIKAQLLPLRCGARFQFCGLLCGGLLRLRFLLLRRAAGKQQQRGKKRQKKLFHPAGVSVADAKFRVYSISWGVLMAVVSPMTVRSVSKAATGISNVEPGSVVRTSQRSPSTII